MSYTFSHWSNRFGDQVSKMREAETGEIYLTMRDECDEDLLHDWYMAGMKPKEAAKRFMAGEARAK
jgi:hypothetical protein